MLVLSRKPGERIRIGSEIELRVLEVRGDRVRIGFEAPTNIKIHREEIHQRIVANLEATTPPVDDAGTGVS